MQAERSGSIPFAALVLIVLLFVLCLFFASCLALLLLLLLWLSGILHRLALLHRLPWFLLWRAARLHFPALLRCCVTRLRLLALLLRNVARLYFTAFLLRRAALFRLRCHATLLHRLRFAPRGFLALRRLALLNRATPGLFNGLVARCIVTIALNRFWVCADRGRPALLGCADRARRYVAFNGWARHRAGCRLIPITSLIRLR